MTIQVSDIKPRQAKSLELVGILSLGDIGLHPPEPGAAALLQDVSEPITDLLAR